MISFFSYIHNALDGGYPIRQVIKAVENYVDEIVIADCCSDDGTLDMLKEIRKTCATEMRIIPGIWGKKAGQTLAKCHELHKKCQHNIIIHCEADEVFSDSLIKEVINQINQGTYHIAVWRLQVEQNFQRVRWYPVPVHRVFIRGSVKKSTVGDHTTEEHEKGIIDVIPPEHGFLWDVQPPRDNWLKRIGQNTKLWQDSPSFKRTPKHFMLSPEINHKEISKFLKEPHWEWTSTPLNIPDVLKPLLGITKYA